MNILNGIRLANRNAAAGSTAAVLSAGVAVGAAASVLSIKDAITGTKSIEQERLLRGVIYKLRKAAMASSRAEKQRYVQINDAERESLNFLTKGANTLIFKGLSTVGNWFVRTAVAGIRYAIIPMFSVLKFAFSTVFRLVLTNPWVMGTLAAAGAAYALYRKFWEPDQPKPEPGKLESAEPVKPSAPTQPGQPFMPPAQAKQGETRSFDSVPAAQVKPEAAPALPKLSSNAEANRAVLVKAMDAAGFTNPKERAAFMAQMDHESKGFKSMEEEGSSKYFAKYDNRKKLGNTSKGDGEKYKGRGFIQLTGKANYATYGKRLGINLIDNPELAADPETAAKIALMYWSDRKLGEKAREGDFDGVTRGINGGLNGKADRDKKYAMYLELYDKKTDTVTSDVTTSTEKKVKTETYQIPTYGRLSSTYGTRTDPVSGSFTRKHKGIDIAAPEGTPVYAMTSGKATTGVAGGYGNLLQILGEKYDTRYAHLSEFLVKHGQSVEQGQVVAKVGNTGRSTGAHLHFEIRDKGGSDIDPGAVLALPPKTIEKSMVTSTALPNNRDVELIQRNGKIIRLEK